MTDQTQVSKPLSARIWPWLFAALGVFYLAAAVRGGEEVIYSTLKGIGFLLAAPQACLDQFASGRLTERATKLINGLGYVGVVLLAIGLFMDIFNL